ncbi:hypothetical protein EJ05DRAFT_471784 [Pseudovirgaria hyperparasitica]|uniref:Uncharacterized protein n=1 Tax=Pseudovirgaria hyperparasitica TaxID=470096 RepID=A0A6A6WKU9_9PEZI|nr:uncharacterized protein EJ05DRAFT_471784 [Pseudovirgaria hyperparasitica]KAF2762825.1 hypothetical protein EJ05DRAFT_471784 [Pseudovirgaria hyperparasitica]
MNDDALTVPPFLTHRPSTYAHKDGTNPLAPPTHLYSYPCPRVLSDTLIPVPQATTTRINQVQ